MTTFDTRALQHKLNFNRNNKVEYFIGVDMSDKQVKSFCLLKKVNGEPDYLIISKSTNIGLEFNKLKDFKKEVKYLAKYFNATIVGEVNL